MVGLRSATPVMSEDTQRKPLPKEMRKRTTTAAQRLPKERKCGSRKRGGWSLTAKQGTAELLMLMYSEHSRFYKLPRMG